MEPTGGCDWSDLGKRELGRIFAWVVFAGALGWRHVQISLHMSLADARAMKDVWKRIHTTMRVLNVTATLRDQPS